MRTMFILPPTAHINGIMLFNQRFSLTKRGVKCIVNGSLLHLKTDKH